MKRQIATPPCVSVALGCAVLATALACAGPAWAAPKPRMVDRVVTVTNHRASPVVSLALFADDDAKAPENMLKTPLKQGQTRKLTVKAAPKLCSFSVSGQYEDGTEIGGSGLDLCKDKVVALVD